MTFAWGTPAFRVFTAPSSRTRTEITAILNRIVGVQNTQMAEFVAAVAEVQKRYLEQLRNELNEVRELKDELSAIRKELHASRNLPAATVSPALTADQDHRAPASDGIPALTDGPCRDADATRQHEWIMQRLAQIESERTGRWKTVLQALTRPILGATELHGDLRQGEQCG